jgi:hypothetical protein
MSFVVADAVAVVVFVVRITASLPPSCIERRECILPCVLTR